MDLQVDPPLREPLVALLASVLGVSLLVCLCNPYHVRAFELPPPLSFLQFRAAIDDPTLIPTLSLNPFSMDYIGGMGTSAPGLAYAILIVLGLLSFWLNRARLPATWALLWLVFAALSFFDVRLIPFFAIIAGPCLARNIQEWHTGLLANKLRGPPSRLAAPGIWERLLVGCEVLLLVLAWPGWLQPQAHERRGFELVSEPALESAAKQVLAWRQQGLLSGDQHTFNYNIETAHYLAWLGASTSPANREKGFVNVRMQLFPSETLRDFSHIRRGLQGARLQTRTGTTCCGNGRSIVCSFPTANRATCPHCCFPCCTARNGPFLEWQAALPCWDGAIRWCPRSKTPGRI